MIRRLLLLLLAVTFSMATPAQRSKSKQPARQQTTKQAQKKQPAKKQAQSKRKPTQKEQLQAQQRKLQQDRAAAQRKQQELERQVKQRMKDVQVLGNEISEKRVVIDSIRREVDTLNKSIKKLNGELATLQKQLEERRQRYIQSVRYLYRNRKAQTQMMFILSAKNYNQMYQRMRFSNEYATYQRAQGEAVKQKREQVERKQQELQAVKDEKTALLERGEQEQKQLQAKQEEEKGMVASLQKQKKTVETLIAKQRKEEAELNDRIEKLIAEEVARAKAAAEAEARRRAEAERKRNSQAQNSTPDKQKGGKTKTPSTTTKPQRSGYMEAAEDRQLSGNFANNKGKLPVPITGPYKMIRGFGSYTVAGLKGVTLESKGISLEGKAGAQARCVFDGVVSGLYAKGGSYIVMVRHGRYISVYCNLSRPTVTMGQQVKTNQILGNVGADHVLQFQLRNWTEILNPKPWLSK